MLLKQSKFTSECITAKIGKFKKNCSFRFYMTAVVLPEVMTAVVISEVYYGSVIIVYL
jgi:hypothetical protein